MSSQKFDQLNKSPMQDYISQFDDIHIKWGYDDYWLYAKNTDYLFWNTLFIREIEFRKRFGLNLVWSVEGDQGDGKSMGLLRTKQLIDEHFGNKFDIDRFIDEIHFFDEDLESSLSVAQKRSCHVLDEQPRGHGLMVHYIQDQLANYEDTFRKPQINIGYASPSLRNHQHFFIFEALGDIFVDEDGNPTAVNLMLKTKRKSDKMIMPRGIIKLKIPEKEVWKQYNLKKDGFIKKMQDKQGGIMDRIDRDAKKVIDAYGEKLYRFDKQGNKQALAKKGLELYMYRCLGMRAYTVSGYELLLESIKQKL